MKEFKVIPWKDRQDLIDVINSRIDKPILKSSNFINRAIIDIDINRLDIYAHNYVVGLYVDGVLDCFSYIYVWTELKNTYSVYTYTRYKPEGREKYSNSKQDKNRIELNNYRLSFMESQGYYSFYVLLQDTDLEPIRFNEDSRLKLYESIIVEKIAPKEVSKSPLFRFRLINRPFDAPLQIVFCTLPFDLRTK
jgi:hypothetical protein